VAEAEAERSGIVVVEPDEKARNLVEALEGEIGRPVFAIDPSEFDPEASEDIQKAEAFVVCWDLGIRCGADLLEAIRASALLSDRKVLIAMDAPTRNLVAIAMRLGADGVCHRPYDADELAAGLERAGLARPEAAA